MTFFDKLKGPCMTHGPFVLAIGDVIDGDEAGYKGKTLNDQRRRIVEQSIYWQAENATLHQEKQ